MYAKFKVHTGSRFQSNRANLLLEKMFTNYVTHHFQDNTLSQSLAVFLPNLVRSAVLSAKLTVCK